MVEHESDIIVPRGHEFQSIVGYRDWERIPNVVARQTTILLDLIQKAPLMNAEPAKEYLLINKSTP